MRAGMRCIWLATAPVSCAAVTEPEQRRCCVSFDWSGFHRQLHQAAHQTPLSIYPEYMGNHAAGGGLGVDWLIG